MANPTARNFLRPTPSKRPAGNRGSTPRYVDRTRQQTLTQIDFVTRLIPDEHVELEFEEVMGPPKSKRRRTNAKRKPVENIYDGDAAGASIANAGRRGTLGVDLEAGVGRPTNQTHVTEHASRASEVPSSQKTPTKTKTAGCFKADPSPLKDASVNLPDCRSATSRRRRKSSDQQPRLEVRDSYPSENGHSELPHKLPILRSLVVASTSQQGGLDDNEDAKPERGRDQGKTPDLQADDVSAVQKNGLQPATKEAIRNEPTSAAPRHVLEIQDSEGELSDEDELDPDEDHEDQDYEPETEPPGASLSQEHDGEPRSDEQSSTQSSYGIGAETQAIVDGLELSLERPCVDVLPPSETSLVKEEGSPLVSAVEPKGQPVDGAMGEKKRQQLANTMTQGHPLTNNSASADDFTTSSPADEQPKINQPKHQPRSIPSSSDSTTAPQSDQAPARPRETITMSSHSAASLPPTPLARTSELAAVSGEIPSSLINANFTTATQLLPESLMDSFLPMPPLTQGTVKDEEDDDEV